jgi:asparagine synthetase B (glutamine-hydrolysing)
MSGIVCPAEWRKIIRQNLIVPSNGQNLYSPHWLLRKLFEAVQFSLQTLGEEKHIALCLSGGLDSSVLAALLSKLRIRFTAVTVAAEENHADLAKMTAEQFRFSHQLVKIPSDADRKDIHDILFSKIKLMNINCAICGDAADELFGGYWLHQIPNGSRQKAFQRYWQNRFPDHLNSLNFLAGQMGISVALPYLAAHEDIEKIIMRQRVNPRERKIILRQMAQLLELPEQIINRPKLTLCNAQMTP